MSNIQSNAQEVIERLLSAYGVTTQRALAEALHVPSNNVSAWAHRNSVPGNAIIKCALDTGTDLRWLVNGELAKAKSGQIRELLSGEEILKEISSNGGKTVLRRIMDAYGFTLQKQLCELLGISSGTVSTWIRRNYFPGDVVVACALETGVDLHWLAIGKYGNQKNSAEKKLNKLIPHKKLSLGILTDVGCWDADLTIFSQPLIEPMLISCNATSWLVDLNVKNLSNGQWLLDIEGKYDIYSIAILPGQKINVLSKESKFTCSVGDISVIGKVMITLNYNF
ncbi:CI repressor [Pantoea agglomerans 299R]|nr:phage repressor protein CI [Pantoea agglomerans]ELP23353.1 CI repressor [Pantoea agglomerans 299R]